jgi:hypothetical protein
MHKQEKIVISKSDKSRQSLVTMGIPPRIAGQTVTITGVSEIGVSFETVIGKEFHISQSHAKNLFPVNRVAGKLKTEKPTALKSLKDL